MWQELSNDISPRKRECQRGDMRFVTLYQKSKISEKMSHVSYVMHFGFCFSSFKTPSSWLSTMPKFFHSIFRGTMAGRVSTCFFFVFALSLLLPFQISAEESSEKEFVLTLDHSNFHDTVSKHDFIVVEFYAPWYASILSFALAFLFWLILTWSLTICFDFVVDLNFFFFFNYVIILFYCILHWFNFYFISFCAFVSTIIAGFAF